MKRFLMILLILAMLVPAFAESAEPPAAIETAPEAAQTEPDASENTETAQGPVIADTVPNDALPEPELSENGTEVAPSKINAAESAPVIEDAQSAAPEEGTAAQSNDVSAETPKDLVVGKKTLSLGVKESYTIPVSFADGSTNAVTFASSNAKIVKVTSKGVITGVKKGTATVRVISGEDFADISVTVKKAPSKVTLEAKTVVLGVGETRNIACKLTSGSAGSVSWKSGNKKVFTVAADGTVTAVGTGSAKLTAQTYNGKKATMTVKVSKAPKSISVDKSKTLGVGQKTQLTAQMSSGSAGTLTWASTDPSVVTVDASGVLTAVSAGEAVVTVTAYNGLSAGCTVTVKPAPKSVSMFCKTITLGVGETIAVPVICDADCEPGFSYSSSAKKYAKVSADGTITAVKKGTAVITAKTYNGKKAKVTVKVVKGKTSLSLSPETLSLNVGTSQKLKLTGSAYAVVSTDTNVATVTANGTVTGVGPGETDITAYGACGRTAVCRVSVGGESQIVLDTDTLEMGVGQSAVITYRKVGGECTAASSNKSVAKASADGTVKALKAGTCVIRFSLSDSVYADCAVTVKPAPTSIALADLTLSVGATVTPGVTVKPANAYAGGLTWTSSDEGIVRAESDGTLRAVAAGECTVTAQTYNGKKAKAKVTVGVDHTALKLSQDSLTMELGGTAGITVTYEDSSACSYTLASADTGIVKILSDGVTLYGAGTGSTTVTITAENGLTAKLQVTVEGASDSFIVAPASADIFPGESVQLAVTATRFSGEAVKWESSDAQVAKVDQNGLVTGVNAGTCIITVTSENKYTARCAVTVSRLIMDISHYNTVTDFDALARNVSFVILRATCGTALDTKFAQYAAELNARGVPFGVYCYGKAQSVADAQSEAKLLYETANAYGPKFYTYDAETDYLTAEYITAFAAQLRSLGVKHVGCYVAHHRYTTYGFSAIADKFDFVWIPRYGSNDGTLASAIEPKYACDLWQYTSTAKFDFISGSVDLNKITGTGKSLEWFMN